MRIKVIDGFRAVAVLGVLWAHIWMFSGNPALMLLRIDISRFISFFGTGVDLFFVISGFCMYLMYSSKKAAFSFNYYAGYLKKRWLRIAPAFYAAILIYGLIGVKFVLSAFDWNNASEHALFIKNFFPTPVAFAPHFWSLCTEWHFYMVLPFIILAAERFSFNKAILAAIITCLLFRSVVWTRHDDLFNVINYSIPNRLIEFIMGILAAKVYLQRNNKWMFNTKMGMLIGIIIAFAGRALMSAGMQDRNDSLGILSRVFNIPLLTAGYALLIINTLRCKSLIGAFLETRLMTSIGKYSYSMYLWHWVIAQAVFAYANTHWRFDPFIQLNLVFILSGLILYPLSMLSYRLFESLYFRKQKSPAPILINLSKEI